eukprot:m.190371 g.190371  ORF g.190371 m.190371 type:complete len:458 (+) comp32403_c0_seq1:290-1663(+)
MPSSLVRRPKGGIEVPQHVLRKSRQHLLGDAIVVDNKRVHIQLGPRSLTERNTTERFLVLLGGVCFAFNAGYINGCTMNGFGRENTTSTSVAGFTGSYTKAALFLADGDTTEAGYHIATMLCFLLGALLVGAIMPRRKAWELGPEYGPAFLLGSCLLGASAICAIYYEDGENHREVFYFAAAANGLQNGMTSMYSGNLIRTTHLTGTTTDIGLLLGQLLRGNTEKLWKLKVLALLAIFFFLGSLVSFFATRDLREKALAFNAAFFFLIGVVYTTFVSLKHHISFFNAVRGHWKWEQAIQAIYGNDADLKDLSLAELEQLFDSIDVDGDGALGPDEIVAALLLAGVKIKRKNIKAMLKAGDTTGNGEITKYEFVMLLGAHLEGKDEMDVAQEIHRSKSAQSMNKLSFLQNSNQSESSQSDEMGLRLDIHQSKSEQSDEGNETRCLKNPTTLFDKETRV